MGTVYKSGLVLFSKEIQTYPSVRALYFVELDTLDTEHPVLHRFTVRHADFERYVLGCEYDIQARGNHIEGALLNAEDQLPPEAFLPLMERRDLQFMPLSEAKRLRRKGKAFFDPESYYTYEETRELLEFETGWAADLLAWVVFVILRGLSLLIPVALYLITVYNRIHSLSYGASGVGRILSVPVYALSAAIFMVFLMMALGVGVETLTLHMDFTRWFLLKRAVLRNAGRRVSINPTPARLRKLIVFGAISFALLLIVLFIFAANGI